MDWTRSTTCVQLIYTVTTTITTYWRPTDDLLNETTMKHRTDRETAAEKAQINYHNSLINLYTAYYALHDESSQKFYWTKFTDDQRMTYWRKRRNTALTEKLLQEKPNATTATL